MNKVICTTTINPPTEALIKFASMDGWQLVIAGDKKTPEEKFFNMDRDRCYYIAPQIQEQIDKNLSDLIGWNCIQRRNFAFLFACKELKADIVATIDDDNIPLDGWGENLFVGTEAYCDEYITKDVAFDPLYTSIHPHLWHRG